MWRPIPSTEPLSDDISLVEAALQVAAIMVAMMVGAGLCSGIVTLALMS